MGRCSQCPNVNLCLPPDGPRGDLLFVGEAPGGEENRRRCVFVGKTGREVNEHYLVLAGKARSQVRMMNAISCLPNTPKGKLDPNSAKHQALLAACAEENLYPELAAHTPKVIVPMGAFACRAIDPAISLDIHHGMPLLTHWGIWAFPMYHPALGMHSPKKMLEIRTDWIRLKKYLKGTLVVPVDEYPEPDYAEIVDPMELGTFYLDPTQPIAMDTESSPRTGPYCVSFSQSPGTARLVRTDRADLMSALAAILESWESDIYFHNWLYDARVLSACGLLLPNVARRVRDTMSWAYHLGNLPQRLKALSYRLLGMKMQDFDDLVRPYSTERVLDYYRLAQAFDWPKPEAQLLREGDDYVLYQPQSMNTKFKRFFTDYGKNPEKDVFKMWTDNWTEEQAAIEAQCGPWPGIDIGHVPFDEALHYACRDSDALIRLAPILLRMRERVRQYPQEEWAT